MPKFFVVSDVHSFFDELMVALNKNGFDEKHKDHILCVCGDLFDRGGKTVELFRFVKNLQEQDRFVYVRGNHEDLIVDCMQEIECGMVPSPHHFFNQTVKTICQFCGENEWIVYDPAWKHKICETMQPILDWMDESCVDYFEIGDYILCHGWVPFRQGLDGLKNASKEDWQRARWENGMELWRYPRCRIDGKTVICGHFHCSYGWSHIRMERKEFPNKSRKDWEKSFAPFVDDGIMAIDSCCAYSGLLNCIVIEGR